MDDSVAGKPHWSFWFIAVLMLIWNGLGCANFIVQMNPDVVASYRAVEQAIIQDRPLWATAGFALGVFAGAVGCVLLLLKNPSAFYLFCASLLGVVIAIAHSLTVNYAFGLGEIVGIVVMPIAVALFLVGYARYCQAKGWLNFPGKAE